MKYFTIQKEILHNNIIPPPSLPGPVTSNTVAYLCICVCLLMCIWELAPSKGEDDTTEQASPYHTPTTSSWPPPQVTAVTYHPVHLGVLKKILTHLSKKHHPTSITGMESEVGVKGLLFHRYVRRWQSYNQPRRKQAKKTCK